MDKCNKWAISLGAKALNLILGHVYKGTIASPGE